MISPKDYSEAIQRGEDAAKQIQSLQQQLASVTKDRDEWKEHAGQSDTELCQLQDALGLANQDMDVQEKAMERLRDLIAAEGELGDEKLEHDKTKKLNVHQYEQLQLTRQERDKLQGLANGLVKALEFYADCEHTVLNKREETIDVDGGLIAERALKEFHKGSSIKPDKSKFIDLHVGETDGAWIELKWKGGSFCFQPVQEFGESSVWRKNVLEWANQVQKIFSSAQAEKEGVI